MKRYTIQNMPFGGHTAKESTEGEWVKWEDHQARVAKLEDALSDLLATIPDYKGDDRNIAVAKAIALLRQ